LGSLASFLELHHRQKKELDLSLVNSIAREILTALAYLHEKAIVRGLGAHQIFLFGSHYPSAKISGI